MINRWYRKRELEKGEHIPEGKKQPTFQGTLWVCGSSGCKALCWSSVPNKGLCRTKTTCFEMSLLLPCTSSVCLDKSLSGPQLLIYEMVKLDIGLIQLYNFRTCLSAQQSNHWTSHSVLSKLGSWWWTADGEDRNFMLWKTVSIYPIPNALGFSWVSSL